MDNQKKMTVTLFKVKEMDCPSEENINNSRDKIEKKLWGNTTGDI